MRKPHEWVLFQVNKIHKPNCPTKKTNSKRKTLNGCCQICIKTVKMSQKREKPQGGRPWKLGERKWRFWREVEDEWAAAFFSCRPNSWSYHPCHSELQNCHYKPQNYKNATMGLKCWPIDFADVEMTWKWCGNDVASLFHLILMSKLQNLLHPNT